MGKYDKLKGKLPAFQQEPSFQQKVDEAKSEYLALEPSDLARTFSSVKQRKKSFEDLISIANIELEALSQMLVENFEVTGLSKFQLSTGETCYQQTEPYSSVMDQEALLAWVKKEKMQALLSLAWATMNALNKERLVAGKAPLPGTAVFLKTSVRLRGGSSDSQEE
jgi:hypothetical protein